jgi:asparagine synthase (glutamine-hydrolysing)
VAERLGTEHTEHYVTPVEAMGVIPELPQMYDEPFADSSQIPTHLVSRLARQHVTVTLSGDGGDELFLGYDRYRWTERLSAVRRFTPGTVRHAASRLLLSRPPATWDRLAARLLRQPPSGRIGERVHRTARLLEARDPLDLYSRLVGHGPDGERLVIGGGAAADPLRGTQFVHAPVLQERLGHLDALTYLPDDILAKVDRASMAVSLESRIPLLDPRVAEFAWRLDPRDKLRSPTKWPLRQVLYRHLPRDLVDRPKMGFGIPVAEWLRGPLRSWAESLLSPAPIDQDGYLDGRSVRAVWDRHLQGSQEVPLLWDILMFQAWLACEKAPTV